MMRFDSIKKISTKPWFYPVALFLLGAVTYEWALPAMGFAWDDWEVVMFNQLPKSMQFAFYMHDRPFPWTYQLTHFLVGSAPMGWHIITLLYRWAGVVCFSYAMMLLWPRYESHLRWLGALILVYPGFLQQSQASTKDRHIATFFLFALSIYLMALAVKRPKSKWSRILFPLSWATAFLHLFTTEYFLGLELTRPLLLWLLVTEDHEKMWSSFRRAFIKYIPYLTIAAFYLFCRFYWFPILFHTTSRFGDLENVASGFQTSLGSSVLESLNRALFDSIYLTLRVWVSSIFNFPDFDFESKVAWFAFGLGIVLTILFAFFHDVAEKETPKQSSPLQVFVIGFIFFIMGALPIWAIGRQISGGGWEDRFALAPLLGASLMVMALVLWLVQPSRQKLVFSVLLIFSIAAQVWAVNVYRLDWLTQRTFYWQLYWRAPALKEGTAVFSMEQPSVSVTHYADAGYALNILYHFQTQHGELPYWYYARRYKFDYVPNIRLHYDLRNVAFDGNTSDGIAVFHQSDNSCLLVLEPIYAGNPLFTNGQDALMPVSNLSRIVPDPQAASPDPNIFGAEPPRGWCYYFEKADLARQFGDWKTILKLYKESQQNGYEPNFGMEYIPFIEAYAQTGDWQKAADLTLKAQNETVGIKKMLCNTWTRLGNLPSPDAKALNQVRQSLGCSGF